MAKAWLLFFYSVNFSRGSSLCCVLAVMMVGGFVGTMEDTMRILCHFHSLIIWLSNSNVSFLYMAYLVLFIKACLDSISTIIIHPSVPWTDTHAARCWYEDILPGQFYFLFSKKQKCLPQSSSRNLWSVKVLTESPLEIASLPYKWFLVL